MTESPKLAELLAPAGSWECARAAVENGADAIYFGLEVGFNARARATNFQLDQLPQLMGMLHRQAVRGYVTLNTLVFTDELAELERNVRRLAETGVDAVIVQDLGVVQLVREICPELVVHASTQMTLTHPEAINLVAELGVQRVVLARELSLAEIWRISASTSIPLEAFVHGALCVAYSGQCLTSESFGGRSANRGQCAQACRLPYELVCDDQPRDLGDVKYLLSPQDLAAHDLVPQLLEAGVSSFKIEGRLKSPEYVANVCQHYRAAIDEALTHRARTLTAEARRELELSFSRGFSPGWLEGCDHKRLVPGLSSSKRGAEIGSLLAANQATLTVDLHAPLCVGDGIVVEGDRFAGEEIGGRVTELRRQGKPVERVEFGHVELRLHRVNPQAAARTGGNRVFKTDDPKLTKRLRRSFEVSDPQKRVPIELDVTVAVGQPISVTARVQAREMPDQGASQAVSVELVSEHRPEEARKHPLDDQTLVQQFSRLGGSVYRLESLNARIDDEPMVPLSVLGKLRRELIERLDAARITRSLGCREGEQWPRLVELSRTGAHDQAQATPDRRPVLRVLCRSLKQLRYALAGGASELIAEFHDLREYRQAVELAREAGTRIELATLRIQKPGEQGLFHALAKHAADGWLVRNLPAVEYCRQQGITFACDFSLNVTNPITAGTMRAWGATRMTPAYDLNREQLLELVEQVPSDWLEVVLHQHMPMFHMEHCVFCSVLSPGKNKSDCGRPCDRHDVKLKDQVGEPHVLHADIGCRNTLYNAVAQSGAEACRPLMEMGVRQFRIELLRDASEPATRELIELYQALLRGEIDGTTVWKRLKASNRVGVTRGTFEQPRNPLAIL